MLEVSQERKDALIIDDSLVKEEKSEPKDEKIEPEKKETPEEPETEETDESKKKPEKEKPEEPGEETSEDEDESEEEGEDEEVPSFTYNEKKYSDEELETAIKDSENRESWEKSFKSKDQVNADMRTKLEPMIKLMDKLKSNRDTITEKLIEVLGENSEDDIDSFFDFDVEKNKHPDTVKLGETETEKEDLEIELALLNEKIEFMGKYKKSAEETNDILEFMIDHHKKTKQALSYEDAYKLMNYDKIEKKSTKKKPKKEIHKTVTDKPGAKNLIQTVDIKTSDDVTAHLKKDEARMRRLMSG